MQPQEGFELKSSCLWLETISCIKNASEDTTHD